MSDPYTKIIQQMTASGQEMMRAFNPKLEDAPLDDMASLFPTMSAEMMEMWFGRMFNRDGLDTKSRLFVTLAALTVLGAQAEPQIKITVEHALEAGATEREITEVIWLMSMFGGLPAMQKALEIAQKVFAETKETDA